MTTVVQEPRVENYLIMLAKYTWLHLHPGDGMRRLIHARGEEELAACDCFLDPYAKKYKHRLKDFCETHLPQIDSRARFNDWCASEPTPEERQKFREYMAKIIVYGVDGFTYTPNGWEVIEI